MDIVYAYIHAQKDKISKDYIYVYLYVHMYYKRKNEPLCILDIGYIIASINICKDNLW